MTRTKLRALAALEAAQFINDAVGIVERNACRVCRSADNPPPGHRDCWVLVLLAREIRKLGERGGTK